MFPQRKNNETMNQDRFDHGVSGSNHCAAMMGDNRASHNAMDGDHGDDNRGDTDGGSNEGHGNGGNSGGHGNGMM